MLGLVPPSTWFAWFGLADLPMAMGMAVSSLVVPMLTLAWFAIVTTTGIRQWRAAVRDRERDGAMTVPIVAFTAVVVRLVVIRAARQVTAGWPYRDQCSHLAVATHGG